MKKFSVIMLLTILFCAALLLNINASKHTVIQNPDITVNRFSPKIDGDIDPDEGWSKAATVDDTTVGYFYSDKKAVIWADVYFACDKDGFYFAADVFDGIVASGKEDDTVLNQLVLSSGLDTIDGKYAWNGDTLGVMLDPLDALLNAGRKKSPCFMVSMFEDGPRMIRRYNRVEEVTSRVKLAGSETVYGWRFESFLPWNVAIPDAGSMWLEFDSDTILKSGDYLRAGVIYIDRYIDEVGKKATYNVYSTVPELLPDGTPGVYGKADDINSLGIMLRVSDKCVNDGHSWSVWHTVQESSFTDTGRKVSYCDNCGVTAYRDYADYLNRFKDVKEIAWYAEAVGYCVFKGYMSGMSENSFSPSTVLTREQFVVMLANYAGVDVTPYKDSDTGMSDVPKGRWYSAAVAWAVDQGYVKGVAPGVFGVGRAIKRAELARLLYLYSESIGRDTSTRAELLGYSDHSAIASWMYEPLQWAVYNGIITSMKTDVLTLSPATAVSRAQAAMMLKNYDES